MNYFFRSLLLVFSLVPTLYAVGEPLIVGITNFTPPFIMQDANKNKYGFDIDMMNFICKNLERTCQFRVMRFDELIPAIAENKIDVAVSSLTITADRTKIINFSLPYLLSHSQFLTRKANAHAQFNLTDLDGKTIGVRTGSIFEQQINQLGIKEPSIKEYVSIEEMLDALGAEKLDYVLLDSPTTMYWAANSSGAFVKAGPKYLMGYGLGIATTPENLPLINKALLQYQANPEYKLNYDKYILQF